ncbi:hypothetical protein Pmar_PMAR011295, partial [Perkinsus marinus ATCC 50983]
LLKNSTQFVKYLNRRDVQRKLGVNKRFETCSKAGDFGIDTIMPFETLLPDLLDAGVRGLNLRLSEILLSDN